MPPAVPPPTPPSGGGPLVQLPPGPPGGGGGGPLVRLPPGPPPAAPHAAADPPSLAPEPGPLGVVNKFVGLMWIPSRRRLLALRC